MTPEHIFTDSVYRMSSWQNALVVDVAGCMDLAHMKRLRGAYESLLDKHPGGVVGCSFIRPGTPVSPLDARQEGARLMKMQGLLRVGMVIEEQGVIAQAMKTVIRGINVLVRSSKMVLYRSVDEAVDELTPLLTPPPGGAGVAMAFKAAIERVRRDFQPCVSQHTGVAS